MDVSSLARLLQPERPLLPIVVVPSDVEPVRRGMEASKTSIRRKAAVIGGRLKQAMPKIEPFLYTEMPGNPLTTPAVLVNCGPQVDSDASDCNVKHHKRLHK